MSIAAAGRGRAWSSWPGGPGGSRGAHGTSGRGCARRGWYDERLRFSRGELRFERTLFALGFVQQARELGRLRGLAALRGEQTLPLEVRSSIEHRERDDAEHGETSETNDAEQHLAQLRGATAHGESPQPELVALALRGELGIALSLRCRARSLELGLTDPFETRLLVEPAALLCKRSLAFGGGEARLLGEVCLLGRQLGVDGGLLALFGCPPLVLHLVALVSEQRIE